MALLPDTPLAGAQVAANRILERVRNLGNVAAGVTLSVGLSSLSPDTRGTEQLLSLAQERLERARAAGGDGVEPEATEDNA